MSEHPETLLGRGTLTLPDRTYVVEYEVINGARGRLTGLSPGDIALAVVQNEPVRLILEDGRSAKIFVENNFGDFRVIESITEGRAEAASYFG